MGRRKEVSQSWSPAGDPKELARDLRNTRWAATSKGWVARPEQEDFPEYWIKVFNGQISFLWGIKQGGVRNYPKWYYTNPEEIGILLMQIVFNNSQNIRRVKEG
jgi:hypothetical protein